MFKKSMLTNIILFVQILFGISNIALAEKILKKGNEAEPQSLDPQKTTGLPESRILSDITEGLLTKAANGINIPGAAEKWEVSKDGKTYTFFLREAAKWSNGDPVTADDFVYSWRRMVDPKTASPWDLMIDPILNGKDIAKGKKKIEELGVKAEGKHKLIVTLNAPTPYFLSLVSHSSMLPLHKKTVETYGDKWTKPENIVSNGPFLLAEWAPQQHIKLKKNPQYWDAAGVKLDGVIFYPIDDLQAELKRFKAGDLHITTSVPADQIEKLKIEFPNNYRVNPAYSSYYYSFNTTKSPFDNAKLREALNLAIDREKIVKQITKGDEIPAYGMVPPAPGDYIPQEIQCRLSDKDGLVPCSSLTQEQRETLAKKIFTESGYKPEPDKPIRIVFDTNENHKKVAIAIAGMWKAVLGVETELNNKEWKVYLASREKRDYEIYKRFWKADYNDPNTFLSLLRSDSGQNNTPGYFSAAYDDFMIKSAIAKNAKERIDYLIRAEKKMLSDFPIAPIYYGVEKNLVSDKVISGYEGSPLGHHLSRWIDIQE